MYERGLQHVLCVLTGISVSLSFSCLFFPRICLESSFLTKMRLVILDNYDLASEWAAKYICNRIIQAKPNRTRYFTLGLPTGNIYIHTYIYIFVFHSEKNIFQAAQCSSNIASLIWWLWTALVTCFLSLTLC